MTVRITLDVDQHLTEPPDLWTSRLPKKYQSEAPRVVDYPGGGEGWLFTESTWTRPVGLQSTAGVHPTRINWRTTYDAIDPACYEPKARLEAMDIEGVDRTLLFPSVAMTVAIIPDEDLYLECIRAYNDGVFDWATQADSQRVYPVALIPASGVEVAMAELARVAQKGFRTYMFNKWPSGQASPTPADDPFWALCEETGMIVSIHGGGAGRAGKVAFSIEGPNARPGSESSSGDSPSSKKAPEIPGMTQELVADGRSSGLFVQQPLAMFALTGILERFPKLNIAAVETGAGWMP